MKTTTRHLKSTLAASVCWLPLLLAVGLASVPSAFAANGTWTNIISGGLWSGTANWSSGIVADGSGFSAIFNTIDITADNTVHMDASHTLTTLTFGDTATGTAAGWTVDNNSVAGNILTLAGTTPSITVSALGAGKSVTISAVVAGTTAWTKAGAGTLTLSGANTYAANTTVTGGALNLTGGAAMTGGFFANGGGSLTLNGTFGASATANVFIIGQTAGKGTVYFPAGLTISRANMFLGDNAAGDGAAYQTGGSVTFSQAAGVDNLRIGSSATGKGYYKISGGTVTAVRPAIGASLADTVGVVDVLTGGTFTSTEQIHIAAGSVSSSGLLNVMGGTVNAGTDIRMLSLQAGTAGATQMAVLNVGGGAGAASVTTGNNAGQGVNMAQAANIAGEVSVVNLLTNGTLTTSRILGTQVNPVNLFNFNGGTLKANSTVANPLFNDGGVDAVTVFSNGARIDDSGTTVVIGQPLLAPTGNGITGIAVTAGGSGYVGAPLVVVTGGGGVGATAVANMVDDGTGNGTYSIGSFTITSPGIYSAPPTTVTLRGGGAGTAATVGAISSAPNITSGGLTKLGSGTVTLSGGNTYTGPTLVAAGRLVMNSASLTSAITVTNGATLGVVAIGSSHMSPTNLTLGTNTGGATLEFSVNSTTQAPLTPGTLILSNANTINIVAGNFVAGNSYPLITYGSLSGAGSYALGTLPSGVTGTITTTGNTISLNVATVTNTFWTGLTSGVWDTTTANWTNAGTAGTLYVAGSVVQFDDTGLNTTNVTGGTLSPGAITVNNTSKNYALKNVIAGTTGITKTGTGSLTNTAANTYTGPTIINQGALVVGVNSVSGVSGALGVNSPVTLANDASAILVLTNATVNYATQIGSLTGGGATGGNISLGSATLTLGGDNSSPAAYTGVISGTGGLTKIGIGAEILSGANTYAGATTVTLGTLTMNGSLTTGAGGITLNPPSGTTATLNFSNSGAFTRTGQLIAGNVSGGTGVVTVNDTSSVSFGSGISYVGYLSGSGVLTLTGGTFANAGELQVGGSDVNGTLPNGTGTFTMSGGAANLGSLTVGRGNNNQNSMSGSVTVSGGTLTSTNDVILGFAGTGLGKLAITGSGIVNVGSTATKWLQLGVYDTTKGELDITNGALNLMNNSAIKFCNGATGTASTNVINQSGGSVTYYSDAGVTVGGTGDLDMQRSGGAAANNTYNLDGGTLTVPSILSLLTTGSRTFNFNGGTLKAAGPSATFMNLGAGTTRANVRNGGAIIDNNGYAITIAQALLHSSISGDAAVDGGLTLNGIGKTTLTGANTFTNSTTVNGGTVQITSDAQFGAVPGSAVTNITLNGGAIYNNNSTPALATNRTILLTASGGYLQAGSSPQGLIVNGKITGLGGLGINWDAGPLILNAVNNYQGDTTIGTAVLTYWNDPAANVNMILGVDNALPYGASVGNLIFGTSGQNNTAKLNLNGHNTQVNGLTGSANAIIDNTNASSCVLTVGNNNQGGSFGGVIKNTLGAVALAKTGSGTLTLSGANTYTGTTIITNGTLALGAGGSISNTPNIIIQSGATLDVSATSFTLTAAQNLKGVGTVSGPVTTVTAAAIYPAASGTAGTLSFSSDLNLGAGGLVYFDVSTNFGSGNDQITVGGNLTLSGSDTIHLSGLSGIAALATNADYVLFAVTGSTTMASMPGMVWDGTTPTNYLHFALVQTNSNVVLRYTSTQAPLVTAVASPMTVTRNQTTTITATVIPGLGGVASITVDLSQIGGSSSASLLLSGISGATNYYTNSYTIGNSISPSTNALTVIVTDNTSPTPLVGTYVITPFIVTLANQVWNGGSLIDDNWSSNPNWLSGAGPGLIGDSVAFAGSARLLPSMDNNYSLTGITFSNGASSFNIGTASSVLTLLSGGLVNNSTKLQTLNVPLVMSSAQTFDAAAGDLALSQTVNNSGFVLNFAGVSNSILGGVISGSGGLTKTGAGTLTLTNAASSFTGSLLVKSGTVVITTNASVNSLTAFDSIGQDGSDNGTLTLNGTGSLTTTGDFNVGDSGAAAGTLNIQDNAVLSLNTFFIGSAFTAGSTASGTVNQSGGTVTEANAGIGQFAIGGRNTTTSTNGVGVYNLSGGTLTAAAGIRVGGQGTGTFNLSNTGSLNANAGINIARLAGATGTFNLNGGTITTLNIASSTGINATNNFNGGTVIPTGNNTTFMQGLTRANVRNGGAVIDTAGYNITINQALLHSDIAGDNSTDGGLTKQNSGTLTLGGLSTYTGNTTINGGTLQLAPPVLHLTFDKANGTTAGATVYNDGTGGSAMNGTLTGAATITSGGRFGNALSIPAGGLTANYVLINNGVVPFNNADTWSVGAWIKTSTDGACYLYQGDGAWNSGDTSFYLNNGSTTGKKAGGVRWGQGWETGTATNSDGNWHFVVMTCNGGTKAQYVDGALDTLAVNSWNGTATATQVRIGGTADSGDGNVALNGLIDEVYIYNRALSQAEVQSLYNNNKAQVLPSSTGVTVASGATLNAGGLTQQIGSLAGAGDVVLGDLIVGNVSSTSFSGGISDNASGVGTLTKVGAGALILDGSENYGGITTVSNGTLLVDGTMSGSATVAAGAHLGGLGAISGAVMVNGDLSPGSNSVLGTLSINGGQSLTIGSSGKCTFTLSSTYSSGNDQITIAGGSLTNNNVGNVIHIKAANPLADFDTNGDYVLINGFGGLPVGSISSTPVWDVTPPNYTNYTLVISSGSVVLHYSAIVAPSIVSITASPSTVSRNQSTLITVTVTNGVAPVTVDMDTTLIGGGTVALNQVGASNVYTNTVAATAAITPNAYLLPVIVTDSLSQTASGSTSLTVTLANDIWTGAGADNLWDTNPNWSNSAAPGYIGDSLTFAGLLRLTNTMDNSYTLASVTFSNNAGSFIITNTGVNTMTLTTSGVVNNSTNSQALSVPVILTAAQSINAAFGNLTLGQGVDNGGNLVTVTGASNTIMSGAIIGAGGLTKAGNGTLTLAGSDTFTGNTIISAGEVSLIGAIASGSSVTTTVADTTGKAVLNIASGGSLANGHLILGNSAGGASAGAVYNSGSFTTLGAGGITSFAVGNATGGANPTNNSYGYFLNNTPTATTLAEIGVGGFGGGDGVMEISQGIVDVTNWLTVGRGEGNVAGSEQNSLMLIRNGTVNAPNNGVDTMRFGWSQNTLVQNSVLDMGAGSSLAPLGGFNLSFNLHHANNANATTLVTLSGGASLKMFQIYSYYGTPLSVINLNNGILSPTASTTSFLGGGLTGVFVHSGGVTFDTAGFTITNVAPLLAPTGNGITNIPVATTGSGYIGRPIVKITGGGGVGATAIAEWNQTAGTVTNITITSPGSGYSSTPTVALVGGGFTTAATLGTPLTGAVNGGGLVKTGLGVLTLSGGDTYTGNTTVNGGTLDLVQATLATNSTATVTNGAVLKLDFTVTNQVAALVLNGLSQPNGIYNVGTSPTYITGTGNLQVGSLAPILSSNAYLTGITLNPVVSFSPSFVSNVLSGYVATENYGVPFTVTVTNGDATATNVLTYNGGSPVSLTNGVASGSLNMNLNPGFTNLLSVQVTAQDGLTTKSYTVNVLQIPSQAQPKLTNGVSGTNLVLNWDLAHLGYRLLEQTNNLNKGVSKLTSDWSTVVNSQATNTATIPIIKTNLNKYYRLVYP